MSDVRPLFQALLEVYIYYIHVCMHSGDLYARTIFLLNNLVQIIILCYELCPHIKFNKANIQHSSCRCILLLFIAYTCDDLCQKWVKGVSTSNFRRSHGALYINMYLHDCTYVPVMGLMNLSNFSSSSPSSTSRSLPRAM